MGWSFRKRKSLLDGLVSLNASKRGLGISVGPRGAKMSVGLTGQKKGETRARVGRGGVYWQTGSAGKRRASRDVPTIDAFPRKMTPAEYEEAKNLWDDVEPFIHGTHRGDQIELDENVVRKVLRMQELTGYELIDAKAARTALRET
jgi:Protein of unknown function (DUF4236)